MTDTQKVTSLHEGITYAYWDIGVGEPVVLIHGFTGTATADQGLLMEKLAPNYRVIAPDMRGYGASRPPNRDFPANFYERDALDVAVLLDQLGLKGSVVMGFSDGAEVAVLLAALRPDLVRGVVAWGISGVISPEEVASVDHWLPIDDWGPERDAWRQQIIERHGAEQLRPMVEGWVAAAHAILDAGGNICLAQAPGIQCPVLLLNGVGEVGNVPRDVMRLCEAIPDCRLVFVEDCGHAIQRDQPEILWQQIEGFLGELGASNVPPTQG